MSELIVFRPRDPPPASAPTHRGPDLHQMIVDLVTARPGLTTLEITRVVPGSSNMVERRLRELRADGHVKATKVPGRGFTYYPPARPAPPASATPERAPAPSKWGMRIIHRTLRTATEAST